MTYRANQLRNIPVGCRFIGPGNVMYMRVQDIKHYTDQYPNSITALNMDTYEVMLLSSLYDVREIVEKEEMEDGEDSQDYD